VQLTKQALVFVFNRETGEPLFPIEERPVPVDGVEGEWIAPTQPIPLTPPALVAQGITPDDAWGFTPLDRWLCRREIAALGPDECQADIAVAQDLLDLAVAELRVQRQHDATGLPDRKDRRQEFRSVAEQHGDAVPRRGAGTDEAVAELERPLAQRPIGDAPRAGNDGIVLRTASRDFLEGLIEVVRRVEAVVGHEQRRTIAGFSRDPCRIRLGPPLPTTPPRALDLARRG